MKYMDDKTLIYLLDKIMVIRLDPMYSAALDEFGTAELPIAVSSYDLLHNMIEVRRAKREIETTLLGIPFHRDAPTDVVLNLRLYRCILRSCTCTV